MSVKNGINHYRLSVKLLAGGIVLCVCMAILELGTRISGMAPDIESVGKKHISDSHLPWKVRPGFVSEETLPDGPTFVYKYNSQGFRDEEHDLKKPENTFRIVALGDSFTHGSGAEYEDTYLVKLESMLNSATAGNPKVEIIKMGIGGYWTEPERILLERYGLQYQPDLVIVGFLQNDVIDTQIGIHRSQVKDGYIISQSAGTLGRPGQWLYLNSHFFRIVLSRYVLWKKSRTAYMEWDLAWSKVLQELGKIVALGRNYQKPFETIVFHISQKQWAESGMEDHQQRLSSLCDQEGCVFIDSVPELRKEPDPLSLYWQIDGHCTADGYAVMARALFKGIMANNLIPQS